MSTQEAYSHYSKPKRGIRIRIFNIVCWTLGFFGGIALLFLSHNFFGSVAIGGFVFMLGTPLKDAASPAHWLIKQMGRMESRYRHGGTKAKPPLSRHGKKLKSPWDDKHIVTAGVRDGAQVIDIPLVHMEGSPYLTCILRVSNGASDQWAASDSDGKFIWDLRFIDALSTALAVTNEENIWLATGINSRPSDRTPGYEYNGRRIRDEILAAAESASGEGFDPVDKRQGDNAMNHFNATHDRTGETFNYIAVRMYWPWQRLRRWKKLDITDPDKFEKSNLHRTVSSLLMELRMCDLNVDYASFAETAELLDCLKNLRQVSDRDTYKQRDRELVEAGVLDHIDDAVTSQEESWKPLSCTSNPEKPGYILVDGTFITAGLATAIRRTSLNPGFQMLALAFSDKISYTASTLMNCKLINRESLKAEMSERSHNVAQTLTPWKEGISNPVADRQKEEIVKWRDRLADAGARSADFYVPFIVRGNSLEELNNNWTAVTVATARYYTLSRMMTPDEIIDLMFAAVAIGDID